MGYGNAGQAGAPVRRAMGDHGFGVREVMGSKSRGGGGLFEDFSIGLDRLEHQVQLGLNFGNSATIGNDWPSHWILHPCGFALVWFASSKPHFTSTLVAVDVMWKQYLFCISSEVCLRALPVILRFYLGWHWDECKRHRHWKSVAFMWRHSKVLVNW